MAGFSFSIAFPGAGMEAVRSLRHALGAQSGRWFLWLPPLLGLGVAVYFALPREPAAWIGPLLAGLAALAFVARRRAFAPALLGVAALGLGFAVAQLRTALVAAPALETRTGPVAVTGVIESASPGRADGWRLVLRDPAIGRLPPEAAPRRIRVTARRIDGEPLPGRRLSLRAVLQAPPEPAAPGAFDFARRAYFQRIGAVGFALGAARVEPPSEPPGLGARVNALRYRITGRVMEALPHPEDAIAAALITGERRAIPGDVLTAIRDSGLAHLLAISGLHFALVAGFLYGGLRMAMACVPYLALRRPIKKWAAVGAFAGASGYLLISGASIPTQRAFAMLGIVLLAVMLDRTPISMRSVAIAAACILLISPESLPSASFQLSFAAVVALVAFYEAFGPRLALLARDAGPLRRVLLYAFGIGLTTVIAGLATAPYAVYHFNRFAFYGVVANLVAVPVTGLWIMPCALAAFALMPFGVEGWALTPMGWGIRVVVGVARETASWPGAVVHVTALPVVCLVLVSLGGLLAALWRGRLRWSGVLPILAAVAIALPVRPPDIILGRSPSAYAVRLGDGALAVSPGTSRYVRDLWLRRAGAVLPVPWPNRRRGPHSSFACDGLGCIWTPSDRRTVAIVSDRAALLEDCRAASVVLGAVAIAPWRCPGRDLVIDQRARYRYGAHAIRLYEDGIDVETVAERRGLRPWTAQYRRYKAVSRP